MKCIVRYIHISKNEITSPTPSQVSRVGHLKVSPKTCSTNVSRVNPLGWKNKLSCLLAALFISFHYLSSLSIPFNFRCYNSDSGFVTTHLDFRNLS